MELKVESILKKHNVTYRLIKLSEVAFTVEDVKKFALNDVKLDEICKTIILRGKKTGAKVAILMKGTDKVDFKRAKDFFNEDMTMASRDEVQEVAFVEPGAVCPFLLKVQLYVDKSILNFNTINTGSGDHLYGLEFKFRDLAKVIKFKEIEIKKTLH